MEAEHISGEEIKHWLSSNGKSREWLARQCHVSKATVNGWLSAGRTIPKPTLSILKSLMGRRISINPSLPISTFIKAQDLANQAHTTLDGWIEGLIDKEIKTAEAEGFSFSQFPEPTLKVANHPHDPSSLSTPALGARQHVKYPAGRIVNNHRMRF